MIKNPDFRIRFDVPHRFAVEPGYTRATHCNDFRPLEGALLNAWREPNTGLIMLPPSFLTDEWYSLSHWLPLTDWTTNPDYWQQVTRVSDPDVVNTLTVFWSTVLSAGASSDLLPSLPAETLDIFLVSIAAAFTSDELVWVAKSNVDLDRDEGFVWHYRIQGDELHRVQNWFALQFDDYLFHFSMTGVCRVYQYGLDKTAEPKILEEFEICSPGDLANRDGYFVFLPIPGYGISLLHSRSPQQLSGRSSNAISGAVRGHLVRLPPKYTLTDAIYVHDGGPISLAVMPRLTVMQHKFGMHRIRYTTVAFGTYIDAPFDCGYKPSQLPDDVAALRLDHADSATVTSATATLRLPDDSGAWAPSVAHGQGRQARIKVTLATDDARYTPFVLGTFVRWAPIFSIRDTQPFEPHSLLRLEWTDDELGRFEGHCIGHFKTDAARKVIERGDATFAVEWYDPDAEMWRTLNGGLAQLESCEAFVDQAGAYYMASWGLSGMEARFSEVQQQTHSAFDYLTIAEAVNVILTDSGFPPIYTFPDAAGFQLPPVPPGQNWRFGVNAGDDYLDILDSLLLLLRRENEEYRLRYDWDGQTWVMEQKPRDTGTVWTLTPFPDEIAPGSRVLPIADGSPRVMTIKVNPPEGNIVQARGRTELDAENSEVLSPEMRNLASVYNRDDPDYLGRFKTIRPVFAPLQDVNELAKMTYRIYVASCHRQLLLTVPSRDVFLDMQPASCVAVRSLNEEGDRIDLYTQMWIKRRHVVLDYQQGGTMIPQVTCELSSTWESEMK